MGSNEAPSRPIVLASTAAMAAGWVAAGSLGVLADPFGMAIVYLLVTVVIVSGWSRREEGRGPLWLALAIWLIPLVTPATPTQTILLVAATVGFLLPAARIMAPQIHGGRCESRTPDGRPGSLTAQRSIALRFKDSDRDCLAVVCLALVVFAGYRWACESIAIVWWCSDQLGRQLGHLGGMLTNRSLEVGASFAGLDFLVVSLTLFALALTQKRLRPKTEVRPDIRDAEGGPSLLRAPVVIALLGILGVHLLYLILLSWAWDLSDWLPQHPDPTFDHPYVPPAWDWSRAVAALLPWNVPAVGAILHALVAAILLRSWPKLHQADVSPASEVDPVTSASAASPKKRSRRQVPVPDGWAKLFWLGGCGAAILLPLAAVFTVGGRDLQQKRILANGQGRLDWQIPEHGRFGRESAGTFGMLPSLVTSLGGQLDISNELSEAELGQTDVLLLLRPADWLTNAQTQRIWQYVRDGGSLLVVAGLDAPDDPPRQAMNDLLADTAIRVRRDVAVSVCDNWQAAGQVLPHPALTRRIGRPAEFEPGGSSMELGWRAAPLAVGRWGWSDPGGDALMSNIARCEPGEHLGDLVLAAEQKIGSGTVVVLGMERLLTNEGIVWGHLQVSRLLDYLAHRPTGPSAIGRQLLSMVLLALLFAAVVSARSVNRTATIALLWAVVILVASVSTPAFEPAVPDGRRVASSTSDRMRGLAYIDASHLELFSTKDWVFDGTNGLALNLMRNGYLTLGLTDWSDARVQSADVLVSIAPGRAFSATERQQINRFVADGGLLVCTVGAEQADASRSLLADFRIRVPASPVATVTRTFEPVPMGHVRSLYLDASKYGLGDYRVGVTFHAAWPVESEGEPAEVLVGGLRDRPIVVCREHGSGNVVVVGDSSFAMNKNLEYIGGEPFNGRYENAHFWRWLISRLTTDQEWVPPEEQVEVSPDAEAGDAPTEVEQGESSAQQEAPP